MKNILLIYLLSLSFISFGQSRSIPVKFYNKGIEQKVDSCLMFKLLAKYDTVVLIVSNGCVEFPKLIPYYSHLPKLFYWEVGYDEYSLTRYSSFSEDLEIEEEAEEKESYAELNMGDFFEKDTVSLYINNTVVFYNRELNSDFSTGLTGDDIYLFRENIGGIIEYDKNKMILPLLSDIILIKVCINGSCKEFNLNIEKGKYFSIDKVSDKEVKVFQSPTMIEYD